MIEELDVLNGTMSLEFDYLNSKYTVFLNDNEVSINFEYKLEEEASIEITGNENLSDGSIVTLTVFKQDKKNDYYFNVYFKKETQVNNEINDLVELDIPQNNPYFEYMGPGIACACFLLILFLYVMLFSKRKNNVNKKSKNV